MEEIMLKIDNVSKQYKLGQIGGTTLREELQRKRAKRRGEEDPTVKIGVKQHTVGETFMALNGVSFKVKKGERVGIIGHNGAGKSTLLKLISRVTAPTEGTISMNGRVASMLEVGTGFHGELTGRENIYMNGAILGMTEKEIDAKIEDIIEFSECRQFIDTPVKRYSSGMYVKLAFSVAAHLDSEIMIMDEVLAVGDMAFQKKCLDKMNDVSKREGRTILYVSHNMNTIRQLCDRVVVLDHGKIVFDGDVGSGIAIYYNATQTLEYPKDYDFKDVKRVYHFGEDIFAEEFHFLCKNRAEYYINSKLVSAIDFRSNRNMDDIRIVIRIKDKNNDIKIATGVSDPFCTIKEEHITIRLELALNGLVDDEYTLSFEIIGIDERGNYFTLDNPGVAMPFKIIGANRSDVVWSKQYWGNIRLDQIKIVRV